MCGQAGCRLGVIDGKADLGSIVGRPPSSFEFIRQTVVVIAVVRVVSLPLRLGGTAVARDASRRVYRRLVRPHLHLVVGHGVRLAGPARSGGGGPITLRPMLRAVTHLLVLSVAPLPAPVNDEESHAAKENESGSHGDADHGADGHPGALLGGPWQRLGRVGDVDGGFGKDTPTET